MASSLLALPDTDDRIGHRWKLFAGGDVEPVGGDPGGGRKRTGRDQRRHSSVEAPRQAAGGERPDPGDDYYVEFDNTLSQVGGPLTLADGEALAALLPADGDTAFGLAWGIVHLIETLEGNRKAYSRVLDSAPRPWREIFLMRLRNKDVFTRTTGDTAH